MRPNLPRPPSTPPPRRQPRQLHRRPPQRPRHINPIPHPSPAPPQRPPRLHRPHHHDIRANLSPTCLRRVPPRQLNPKPLPQLPQPPQKPIHPPHLHPPRQSQRKKRRHRPPPHSRHIRQPPRQTPVPHRLSRVPIPPKVPPLQTPVRSHHHLASRPAPPAPHNRPQSPAAPAHFRPTLRPRIRRISANSPTSPTVTSSVAPSSGEHTASLPPRPIFSNLYRLSRDPSAESQMRFARSHSSPEPSCDPRLPSNPAHSQPPGQRHALDHEETLLHPARQPGRRRNHQARFPSPSATPTFSPLAAVWASSPSPASPAPTPACSSRPPASTSCAATTASLQQDYAHLEKQAREKDVQAASLGSLAGEVSALYGLTAGKLTLHTGGIRPKDAAAAANAPQG